MFMHEQYNAVTINRDYFLLKYNFDDRFIFSQFKIFFMGTQITKKVLVQVNAVSEE